jgi:iron(III) transport system permease protein
MFTKKRIIQFLLAVGVFLAVDLWMYHNLTSSFRSYIDKRNFNEVELFAQTAPDDPAQVESWLSGVGDVINGSRAYYFQFNEETGAFDPISGSPLVVALYTKNQTQKEFQKAFESAYYLEPMRFSRPFIVDYTLDPDNDNKTKEEAQLFAVPVTDSTGYQAAGAILMVVPTASAVEYENLLKTLFTTVFLLFFAIMIVLLFTRDPLTGFWCWDCSPSCWCSSPTRFWKRYAFRSSRMAISVWRPGRNASVRTTLSRCGAHSAWAC